MNQWKKRGEKLLCLVLALSICVSLLPSIPVFALEDDAAQTETDAPADTSADADTSAEEEAAASSETTPDEVPDTYDAEPADDTTTEPAADTEPTTETDEPETVSEDNAPYTLSVTFDGTELQTTENNNISNDWSGNSTKMMKIIVTRNKSVEVENDKQYVLCMKTSDVFYFNGLPDVKNITGADEVTILKNTAPTVNIVGGVSQTLPSFSPYSGEIRIKLNPAVDMVTIEGLGLNYNPELVGYTNGKQTVNSPVSFDVVSAGSGKGLTEFTDSDKATIVGCKVDSVKITTGKPVDVTWRTFNSIDNFTTSRDGLNANLNVKDGISLFMGATKRQPQVFKELEYVLHVPYVEVDVDGAKVKYYLSFDENDSALTDNTKGKSGYELSERATYDDDTHTITYKFENVYMLSWAAGAYTPTFKWPVGLNESIVDDSDLNIKGYYWEVKTQKCYTGANGVLDTNLYNENTTSNMSFTASVPDVKINSGFNDHQTNTTKATLALPMIYKDVNLDKGFDGFLGFFDVHNEGATDTGEVNIQINFNSDPDKDKAIYYITQVQLPADTADGTKKYTQVSYTLVNKNGDKISDVWEYEYSTSFSCKASTLLTDYNSKHDNSASGTYYIESLSYNTVLRRNKRYHSETTHTARNIVGIPGVYRGYIEGDVGARASATMMITSVDKSSLTKGEEHDVLSIVEKSTISNDDFIATTIDTAKVNDSTAANISAGSSAKLSFVVTVPSEEYPWENTKQVNGYHVLRDGLFYVCLPEDVSVSGVDQVNVHIGGTGGVDKKPQSVKRLDKTKCLVNGMTAYWWEIEADNINVNGYGANTATVTINLATKATMAGVNWSFDDCIAVRSKDQPISRTGDSVTKAANTVAEMNNWKKDTATALAKAFDDTVTDLGLNLYRANTSVNLNVTRAEAKLDVETALSAGSATSSQINLTNANTDVTYSVTVKSTEGGSAENFSYYIPIVCTDSALDANALVAKNEFGFELKGEVKISQIMKDADADSPFVVYYTKDSGLNSTTIQSENVQWLVADEQTDFSAITAVKIATNTGASVQNGEEYRFDVVLKYHGDDFDNRAGCVAEWRSFGHYTYKRGEAETTNTYPSGSNSVTIQYVNNLTSNPLELMLNTANKGTVTDTITLPTTFTKDQTLSIKEVKCQHVTLISTSPSNLIGAQANSNFLVKLDGKILSNSGLSDSWSVGANTAASIEVSVDFSTALTDVNTDRYVDIVLGNDNIDITYRVKLNRIVAPASATGSGVAVGAVFRVPQFSDKENPTTSCKISKDSAFTALYVVNNFVPGNYTSQMLKWQNSDETPASFPTGTTITMMTLNDDSEVTGYWYCSPSGTYVDLNQFTRMGGKDTYSYALTGSSGITLRYLFVVDFGQATADTGEYQLVFDATAKADVTPFKPVALNATLGKAKDYALSVTESQLTVTVDYTVTDAVGNDSYTEGKSLSLVLTPTGNLPKDAVIRYKDDTYSKNSKGNFVIPLNDVKNGAANLTLESKLFPDSETNYAFTAELYLSPSREAGAPLNGTPLKSVNFAFYKADETHPALSVTGTHTATVSDWTKGQDFELKMDNIPTDYSVTVTAYNKTGGQVTDLLSSVSGVFKIENGVGTYDSSKTVTNKLVLSGNAATGTYRLDFDVKNADGKIVLTVPYYVIVR